MPNWCECDLYVSGPRKSVDTFMARAAKTEDGRTSPFQIASFLPIPKCLVDVEAGSSEYLHEALYGELAAARSRLAGWGYEVTTAEEAFARTAEHFGLPREEAMAKANLYEKNIRETGHKTWYSWCVANWGTKWDASDVSVGSKLDGPRTSEVTIHFQTPWGPPSEGMVRVSEMFPDLTFRLEYFECGMAFQGVQVIEGGEVVEFSSSDYDGDRGG